MDQPVAVITGASRGIGRATAHGLVEAGFHVILLARTDASGRAAAALLAGKRRRTEADAGETGTISWVAADLARPYEIDAAIRAILDHHPHIHLLVNNAGVAERHHAVTPEGIERTLAVNHLAPVRVTHGLLPVLLAAGAATGDARVVNVTSAAHANELDLTAFEGPKGYVGYYAYRQTKLLNLLHAFDLARRLDGTGVTANAVHPGLVGTDLLTRYLPESPVQRLIGGVLRRFTRTPEEGARTPLLIATDPSLRSVTGRYFRDEGEAEPAPIAMDPLIQDGVRLWTMGLSGVDWGAFGGD